MERLRTQGVVGQSGRLRELFDYFVDRGPHAEPATQGEIAAAVFGQEETDADDATVRVYVHRLRKKIDDFYAANAPGDSDPLLEIPAGIYALRVVEPEVVPEAGAIERAKAASGRPAYLAVGAIVLVALAFLAGMMLAGRSEATNPIWQPLINSDRPILLVLGDYYLFGEIDPVRPEEGRLVRDFRVDSAEDLLRMQEADPETFGMAEDVGLNYLPFQTSYALQAVAPVLAGVERPVTVIAASELTSEMLVDNDVVYVGLLSGMGLLEDITFMAGGLYIGDNYDEIVDRESGRRWTSDEARRLASPAFYRDFAYVARFVAPGDALVTVIASERVTGLRGIGPIVAQQTLPETLAEAAQSESFEALFQVTGQQGADLSDSLVLARPRD